MLIYKSSISNTTIILTLLPSYLTSLRSPLGWVYGNKSRGSRVFEGFWGIVSVNSLLFAKDEFFLIYFLHRISYYLILVVLVVNILPSLRSIPQ